MLRVIPTLLLRGHGLVKTRRFAKPVYVGDPRNVVRILNEKEVDELILLDIDASRRGTAIDTGFIREIVSEAFMPVCYGGGVHTVAQAGELLRVGVEKIAVQSAAIHDLGLVRALSNEFGAQCVVGSVDVRRDLLRRPRVYTRGGARITEHDPVRWAEQLVDAGAGEILVQSVDRDGTLGGPDVSLLRRFSGRIRRPLIVGGGLSTMDHMEAALRACQPSGLAVGARFVFYGPHDAVLVSYLEPAQLSRLGALAESLEASAPAAT